MAEAAVDLVAADSLEELVGTLVEEGGSSACMQALDAAAPNAAPAKKAEVDCSGEADDMTCAICLEHIPVEDLCVVKSCNHIYCGKCILAWAVHKDPTWCPQCKAPFTALLTYRRLDGTLSDFPVEESVCLLKRSQWFTDHLKEVEKGKAAMPAQRPLGEEVDARDWADWQDAVERAHYDRFDADFEDDDEVEAYYFSSAAGRARITLGNRRFGEGGFMSAGRQQARPVPQPCAGKGKAAAAATGAQQHRAAHKTVAAAGGGAFPAAEPVTPARAAPGRAAAGKGGKGRASSDCDSTPGSSSSGSSCGVGASGGKHGRRARRKEKQASADARAALLASP